MPNHQCNQTDHHQTTQCAGQNKLPTHPLTAANKLIIVMIDPDAYFGTMVRLNQEIKESEAGKFLADNYGKTVSRRDFDAAFAKSWGKENVKAVKLTCQGNPAYLTEIQISVKADAINAPLSANSFLPQPHPGNCGKTFVIDKAGY